MKKKDAQKFFSNLIKKNTSLEICTVRGLAIKKCSEFHHFLKMYKDKKLYLSLFFHIHYDFSLWFHRICAFRCASPNVWDKRRVKFKLCYFKKKNTYNICHIYKYSKKVLQLIDQCSKKKNLKLKSPSSSCICIETVHYYLR